MMGHKAGGEVDRPIDRFLQGGNDDTTVLQLPYSAGGVCRGSRPLRIRGRRTGGGSASNASGPGGPPCGR